MSQLIVPPIKTSGFILFDKRKIRKTETLSEFIDHLTVYREFNYVGVASKKVVHFPHGNEETQYWLCGKAINKLLMVLNPIYAQNKNLNIEADEFRYVYTAPVAITTEEKCLLFPTMRIVTRVDLNTRKTITSIKANIATFADGEVYKVELGLDELSKIKQKKL